MASAEIDLTEAEREALRVLAQRTGKTENQLLQEAVKRLLRPADGNNWLARLRQAKGIWKDRDDLYQRIGAEHLAKD